MVKAVAGETINIKLNTECHGVPKGTMVNLVPIKWDEVREVAYIVECNIDEELGGHTRYLDVVTSSETLEKIIGSDLYFEMIMDGSLVSADRLFNAREIGE